MAVAGRCAFVGEVGRLWLTGKVDWGSFWQGECRVVLCGDCANRDRRETNMILCRADRVVAVMVRSHDQVRRLERSLLGPVW